MVETLSRTLNAISGYLFTVGFFLGKVQGATNFEVGAACNIAALLAYLLGYVMWHASAICATEYPPKSEYWCGFAKLKEQYELAAFVGIAATILCILMPTLFVPVAYLYLISNALWSIAEYHKLDNPPPDDATYSTEKQRAYANYSLLGVCGSAVTAVAATLSFIFPPLAFPIFIISTIMVVGAGLGSLYYWQDSAFGDYPPDVAVRHSYEQLAQPHQLNFSLQPGIAPEVELASSTQTSVNLPLVVKIDDGMQKDLYTPPTLRCC